MAASTPTLRATQAALVFAALALLSSADAVAEVSPGALELTLVPAQLTPYVQTVSLRVDNNGGGPVRDITVDIQEPPGVQASANPTDIANLAAGTSTVVVLTVSGAPVARPAYLVASAKGMSETGPVAALAAAELVAAQPAASLTLVGNTRLTDASPANLAAVITNLSESRIRVTLRADAGHHDVRLTKEGEDSARATPAGNVTLEIESLESTVVAVTVDAKPPIRRGKVGLIVTASVSTNTGSDDVAEITATRELDVELSATDLLPDPIGVGTVLVVPGLLAVWGWLKVRQIDRRRIGVEAADPAKQLWENKLWLLAAAACSLVIAYVYSAAGFADLLDAYTLPDIAIVAVLSALLGAGLSALRLAVYRRQVPIIRSMTEAPDVLQAAARADDRVDRFCFKTTEGIGLLVHRDGDALILSPRIIYSRPDSVGRALHKGSLRAAAEAARTPDFDGEFGSEAGYIVSPTAVTSAVPLGRKPILDYADPYDQA